jgi:hypothetical protein
MKNEPNSEKAIDAAIDTAAAALAAETYGLSFVAAPLAKKIIGQSLADTGLIGPGKLDPGKLAQDLGAETGNIVSGAALAELFGFDLFGKILGGGGNYVPERQKAVTEAQSEISNLAGDLQNSAQAFSTSGNLGDALTGLQTNFGDRNPVRADVILPPNLYQQVTGQAVSGPTQLTWSQMTPDQFQKLIGLYQQDPGLIGSTIQGSGDVARLPQKQAQQVADNAANQTQQYLNFIVNMQNILSAPAPAAPAAAAPAAPPRMVPGSLQGPEGGTLGAAPGSLQGAQGGTQGALGFASSAIGA